MKVTEKEGKSEGNETTEIYVFGKTAGSDIISGMTILATEPKELTVVNIVEEGSIAEIMKKKDKTKLPE